LSFITLCYTIEVYHVTLTVDLEHSHRTSYNVMKLCVKFEHNRTICEGVIMISLFNLERTVTCYARLLDKFHQV